MRNIKFLLMAFLVAAFFVTGSAIAMNQNVKPKTEFSKMTVIDHSFYVETANQAPQIPFCQIAKAATVPDVELWNFSKPDFVILNPEKLCENQHRSFSWRTINKDLQYDTSQSFAKSDNPLRKPDSQTRLC